LVSLSSIEKRCTVSLTSNVEECSYQIAINVVGKGGYKEKKNKVVLTCRKGIEGIRGVAPIILNLGASWRSEVYVTHRPLCHRERTPLTIEIEAGWAPGQVWKCLGNGRY
jgi:hypothetical protein